MPRQPGQEMFENILALELRGSIAKSELLIEEAPNSSIPIHYSPIWLEDESQRIGLVNIPKELWITMRRSPLYFLDIPFEERLRHITEEYGLLDREQVENAITRISQKLGHLNAKSAILRLKEGKINESFAILLNYYDKHYLKGLHNREGLNSLLHTIECNSVTPENASLLATQTVHQPENH